MPKPSPSPCGWAAPIEFSEETMNWLSTLKWPNAAVKDFDRINDHNELYRRYCK